MNEIKDPKLTRRPRDTIEGWLICGAACLITGIAYGYIFYWIFS